MDHDVIKWRIVTTSLTLIILYYILNAQYVN